MFFCLDQVSPQFIYILWKIIILALKNIHKILKFVKFFGQFSYIW